MVDEGSTKRPPEIKSKTIIDDRIVSEFSLEKTEVRQAESGRNVTALGTGKIRGILRTGVTITSY
jgi:hypothetical protein